MMESIEASLEIMLCTSGELTGREVMGQEAPNSTFSTHTPPYGCWIALKVIFLMAASDTDRPISDGVYTPLVTPVNVFVTLPRRAPASLKASITTVEDLLFMMGSDEGVDARVAETVRANSFKN